MRRSVFIVLLLLVQSIFSAQVLARDFDWLRNLSIQAQADPSGFVASLSTRFHLGGAQVEAVISNVGNQADAYMVLRMAEMSHTPVAVVTERYHRYRHQGWGVMAKQLGIKPGSQGFHALKAGDDLGFSSQHPIKQHGNGHGHGNGRGHGRDKGHHGRPGQGDD